MSGKSTGADPKGQQNGSAQHRTHNDGSSSRAFTVEQKAAVLRVKKCGATAYYDILGLEEVKTTVDDSGIKKAYRKLSLLTHPDKNGYEGADEAFKMVSKAFQCLSDPDKRKRYDQFGGDPDSRFSAAQASSPFSGFAQRSAGGRGGAMFEEEMSPEELFRQFFGGGLGGGFGSPFGGGIFDNGPGFVFNLGGGPGIRVHQFGGGRPRRRPQEARDSNAPQPTSAEALRSMLPLLLLLIVPIISTLLSGTSSSPKLPNFNVDEPKPPYTMHHQSARYNVPYYVDPRDVTSFSTREWRRLDDSVESNLMNLLNRGCEMEQRRSQQLYQQAQGWFSVDPVKLDVARRMPAPYCSRLTTFTGLKYI